MRMFNKKIPCVLDISKNCEYAIEKKVYVDFCSGVCPERVCFNRKIYRDFQQFNPEICECETCGCLVYKTDANKGKGEIRERVLRGVSFTSNMGDIINLSEDKTEEYIYYPYHCNTCRPKEKNA